MKRQAAVITVSDKGARGERTDTSGPALAAMLEKAGWEAAYRSVVPDEAERIQQELLHCADELGAALVLTTGGTGFSPRDVTPEATRAVIQRETPGIPEAMRAESMRITPRGCLSRGVAGIRGRTLIINLPGSEKAARESLSTVLPALCHGADMIASQGSADCARPDGAPARPSLDAWLREAKQDPAWDRVGMYLLHNGKVRRTPRAQVRLGEETAAPVAGMNFSYDRERLSAAVEETRKREGVYYVRVWLNEGRLAVGEDIMYVLVGGDIRPHVIDALEFLVGKIKGEAVTETELTE